ncbi:hypothetical protein EV356DRAFT_495557 [Viridothelium virens]|uniref:Uncharacterized protein n=1 Tax=Viridothelium virens TaxID=1048519 RepID=A0A6A6HP26_VIRVR|nr:hypothetical protein EV356DRAFT_495557 [Viridothelium virens]
MLLGDNPSRGFNTQMRSHVSMPSIRSSSALTSRVPRRSRPPIILELLIIGFKTISLLLIFSILLWALINYGEKLPQETNAECNDRSQQMIGFEGDSDFYGLGIRLGLYLQWASSFLTNCFTPTEREPVIVTYVIFSLSITIAILVKIFTQQCSFVAEIFVVLTMFWGGLNILVVPMAQGTTWDPIAELGVREGILKAFQCSQ